MVTMRDVANAAGVSQSTVSHVLNGTRRIQPATEQAVRDALESLGYVNDGIARSLRTGTSFTIGLAMSAISNPYFSDVVHPIEELVSNAGYSLLLTDTHDDPARETRAVADLLVQRPAGIIMAPSANPQAALTVIAARKIPLVSIDRMTPGFDSVGVENIGPTADLVTHLAGLGHRRIALVEGLPGITTTDERLQGYERGLKAARLPFHRSLLIPGQSRGPAAYTAVTAAMKQPTPPTALVIGNNQMTIGSMRALRDAALKVPQDVAIVGFDDFEWSDLFSPRLTVIAQPVEEMARTAVSMLFERMQNPDLPVRHIRQTPTFIHRDSCGCPLDQPG